MSNFNSTFLSNRSGTYNPMHDYNSTQSRKTSLNHSERTRFHEIGRELRTAQGAQRKRLTAELDSMTADKELTASDARMVAIYAKSGSLQEQDGYSSDAGQQLLDAARGITD